MGAKCVALILHQTVRAELVEALYFPFLIQEGMGFDKLSPNGL
jgi:hypothetical protein